MLATVSSKERSRGGAAAFFTMLAAVPAEIEIVVIDRADRTLAAVGAAAAAAEDRVANAAAKASLAAGEMTEPSLLDGGV